MCKQVIQDLYSSGEVSLAGFMQDQIFASHTFLVDTWHMIPVIYMHTLVEKLEMCFMT